MKKLVVSAAAMAAVTLGSYFGPIWLGAEPFATLVGLLKVLVVATVFAYAAAVFALVVRGVPTTLAALAVPTALAAAAVVAIAAAVFAIAAAGFLLLLVAIVDEAEGAEGMVYWQALVILLVEAMVIGIPIYLHLGSIG